MSSLVQAIFDATQTQNATTSTTPPTSSAEPEDFSTFLVGLLGVSALATLPDWLKLAIIGTLLETCRRVANYIWSRVRAAFNITAHFDVEDTAFYWVMFWLSQQPAFGKARDIEVSTRSFGSRPNGYLVPGEKKEDGISQRELAYVPSPSKSYSLWFHGRPMTVVRMRKEDSLYRSEADESLTISIMTRDRGVLNALLLEAKTVYNSEQANSVSIYVAKPFNKSWKHVATRPKRPLRSIVLEPGAAGRVLDDATDFLASRAWYAARGIPFRRGYLLHGVPGSGKTSLIHALAGALGLDVYMLALGQMGLDDARLQELISDLPERCIALMEDVDAALHHGITREAQGDGSKKKEGDADVGGSRITLAGLLNALDGVGAQEGRVLFATTNCYGALDPALTRPGRMDVHVEFRFASRYQAGELFRRFYLPAEGEEDLMVEKGADGVNDGTPRTEAIAALAERFAAVVPERAFSMAELQGYLMMYKTRAREAAEEAGAWVEAELEEKKRRGRAVGGGSI